MPAPATTGRPGAARAGGIAVRTAHLLTMALFMGASWFDAAAGATRLWLALAAVTGAALVVSEASHGRHWITQVRGLAVVAHVGALAAWRLGVGPSALVACLILGSVGSHLPRALRKWSVLHRAAVD